jgi:hypothetical protein
MEKYRLADPQWKKQPMKLPQVLTVRANFQLAIINAGIVGLQRRATDASARRTGGPVAVGKAELHNSGHA